MKVLTLLLEWLLLTYAYVWAVIGLAMVWDRLTKRKK